MFSLFFQKNEKTDITPLGKILLFWKFLSATKILEKRLDDDSSTILRRYDTYMKTTKPVLDFYSKNPNFHEIDGNLKIEEITDKIDKILRV